MSANPPGLSSAAGRPGDGGSRSRSTDGPRRSRPTFWRRRPDAATAPARRRTGAPTLAVFAYWRAARLPDTPRIEAKDEAWFWSVPLPNSIFNTLGFVEPKAFRSAGGRLEARFRSLLAHSSLLEDCCGAELAGPVQAIDATPYLFEDLIAVDAIRLGDAAVAVDPISSSGVQKAIQSALAGAVVANTLLRKPERADAAMRFYRGQLNDASERHRLWAADHYAAVAERRSGSFWAERAKDRELDGLRPPIAPADARAVVVTPVELSPDASFIEAPCLGGDFVNLSEAVSHPGLAGPVAYLAGLALPPLLRRLPAGQTPLELARGWADRMPLESGLAIAGWLINHGVLVRSADCGRGHCVPPYGAGRPKAVKGRPDSSALVRHVRAVIR